MRRGLAVAVTLVAIACANAPARAVQSYPTLDAKRIERVLADLGLPVGPVDGVWDEETARATCAWRELTGRSIKRSWPTVAERRALKATTTLTVPKGLWVGVNIDLQCQTGYWIVKGFVTHTRIETRTATSQTTTAVVDTGTLNGETATVDESVTVMTVETHTVTITKPAQVLRRVMKVSSGQSAFPTVPGKHAVDWSVNKWWQSTIYPDGQMYRPFFFYGGQALHGSATDHLVKWYPASHGCVRMLHADIDALWDAGFGKRQIVYLYGTWQG